MQSFIGMVGIYNKSLCFLLSRSLQVDWRDMSLGGSVHTRHSEKVAYGSKMLVDIQQLSMYYLDVEEMNAYMKHAMCLHWILW